MHQAHHDRLTFTAHALVRYVERHVDEATVQTLRRTGLTDGELLHDLRETRGTPLERFEQRAHEAFDLRSSSYRVAMTGLSYVLLLGSVPLRMVGDVCITVLPARRHEHCKCRNIHASGVRKRQMLESMRVPSRLTAGSTQM